MCTINKSAHTKKSGNLFNGPRILFKMYIKRNTCLKKTFYFNMLNIQFRKLCIKSYQIATKILILV